MLTQDEFLKKLDVLQNEVRALDDRDQAVIEETASRLEGFNYGPPVLLPVTEFLRCTKEKMLLEIDRVAILSDSELVDNDSAGEKNSWELKLQHISVMVFYFKELVDLRCGVPEAWDEIDELYVHD
jgi:hypothetical protein